MVAAGDLKSLGRNSVPVRVRVSLPNLETKISLYFLLATFPEIAKIRGDMAHTTTIYDGIPVDWLTNKVQDEYFDEMYLIWQTNDDMELTKLHCHFIPAQKGLKQNGEHWSRSAQLQMEICEPGMAMQFYFSNKSQLNDLIETLCKVRDLMDE